MLEDIKLALIQEIINGSFTAEEVCLLKEKILELKGIKKEGVVEFTEKEINTMPKNIKKLLLIDKKRCRLRTKPSGKNTITYEIRYRRDGFDISASGKTIELAKANFISKCKNVQGVNDSTEKTPTTFDSFATYYFNNFRVEKVSKETFSTDMRRYNRYLKPKFKQTPLKQITPLECKKLLESVKAQGKGKTADELHSLLNIIFKSAIAHAIIERNPLDVVLHIQHQRKNGTALTREEEKTLKSAIKRSPYSTAIMILLYAGLRPNEPFSAKIEGNFIVAQNSKRKNKKVEYKKIPIIKALKPFLCSKLVVPSLETLRRNFNNMLPNHILYDLRTTFYTRCDEYEVSAAARDEFVGHSNGVLTNTYRNLSDEYLLKEAQKLDNWV